MKYAAVLALVPAVLAAWDPNSSGAEYSTLTPAAAIPSGALTELTSSFGIAVSKITDAAELSAISSEEAALTATTLEPSSSASSDYESSSASSSSDIAEATESLDLSKYLTLVSAKSDTALAMTLEDSILKDTAGRIGSIVANRQFQFDGPPPQAGAIYAAGWSITENGTLAIGDQDVFFQCLSGSFYNLYDESIGGQCVAIKLQTVQFV